MPLLDGYSSIIFIIIVNIIDWVVDLIQFHVGLCFQSLFPSVKSHFSTVLAAEILSFHPKKLTVSTVPLVLPPFSQVPKLSVIRKIPPLLGGCQDDPSLRLNAWAWLMFAKGMPVVAWGDEQGNTEYRMSLWQHGWTPGNGKGSERQLP